MFYIWTTVHIDRFSDLGLLTEGHAVTITPVSVGGDGTINIVISGSESLISRLRDSLRRVSHILVSPRVLEESK